MDLNTILHHCHHFPGFVYQQARFGADKKSVEVVVRPRKGSAANCARCHQPAPGYDQLAERRFEFISLWGSFVFLLYTMRRVDFGFVCSDRWEPSLKLIRERCSEALHILDRFHIVSNMNQALDKVRAEETSRRKREGRDPILKKSRGLRLKRSENLKDEQQFRFRDLLRYNLKPSEPTFSRQPSSSSGTTTHRLGPPNSWIGAPNHAIPHRTHEENRPLPTHAPRSHPERFPRSKTALQRRRRGAE